MTYTFPSQISREPEAGCGRVEGLQAVQLTNKGNPLGQTCRCVKNKKEKREKKIKRERVEKKERKREKKGQRFFLRNLDDFPTFQGRRSNVF